MILKDLEDWNGNTFLRIGVERTYLFQKINSIDKPLEGRNKLRKIVLACLLLIIFTP